MQEALREAKKAARKNEVPVGAVVTYQGKIIGRGHNQPIDRNDPSAHAEVIALRQAAKKLKNYRLTEADIYVTIEPCAMCAGALVLARIKKVYFGAGDPKAGACGAVFNIARSKKLNHRVEVHKNILGKECQEIIQEFFRKKRKNVAL